MRLRNYNKETVMILVLNADYLPINVTTFKKAFKLVFKGKAEVLETDGVVYSCENTYKKPSVIRLISYVRIPHQKVVMSRENIFKRDDYSCAYCGSHRNLTVDHITPKSRGGDNSWGNLITCCFKCNSKKGDRTPVEAGMILLYRPSKPNPLSFLSKSYRRIDKWQPYIFG
jgi:5-methylcytosine-specific restriction endonuclease McrA